MGIINVLTIPRADRRYERLSQIIGVDLSDNNTENIIVGNSSEKNFEIKYVFRLPIGDREINGSLFFRIENNTASVIGEYDFIPPEIKTVEYSCDIVGSDVRLIIKTINIGENPVFIYKKIFGLVPN